MTELIASGQSIPCWSDNALTTFNGVASTSMPGYLVPCNKRNEYGGAACSLSSNGQVGMLDHVTGCTTLISGSSTSVCTNTAAPSQIFGDYTGSYQTNLDLKQCTIDKSSGNAQDTGTGYYVLKPGLRCFFKNGSAFIPGYVSSEGAKCYRITGLNSCVLGGQALATTGIRTTARKTTGRLTTGVRTTGRLTTMVQTTGVQTTNVQTTLRHTTQVQTTGVQTTGVPGMQTTAIQAPLTTHGKTSGAQTSGVQTTSVQTTAVAGTGSHTQNQNITCSEAPATGTSETSSLPSASVGEQSSEIGAGGIAGSVIGSLAGFAGLVAMAYGVYECFLKDKCAGGEESGGGVNVVVNSGGAAAEPASENRAAEAKAKDELEMQRVPAAVGGGTGSGTADPYAQSLESPREEPYLSRAGMNGKAQV